MIKDEQFVKIAGPKSENFASPNLKRTLINWIALINYIIMSNVDII